MQFQDRVRMITAQLNDFLRLYKRPEHLDQNGALIELREMAEEMNSLMPTSFGPGDLEARITDALRMVRQTYKGRSWPTVSHMIDAMDRVAKRSGGAVAIADEAPKWSLDPLAIMARRMNEGEAVGDEWLYGQNAARLIASGLVPADTLRKYRSALYFAAKDGSGADNAKTMEAAWLERHKAAEVAA